MEKHHDILISDFTNPFFQRAFPVYFSELGESVKDGDRCDAAQGAKLLVPSGATQTS